MSVLFAQRMFFVAGVYGVLVLSPLLFLEGWIGRQAPPAMTHPEFYYGFVCAALAWQLVYLLVARDPLRLRPAILPGALSKATFALAAVVLACQGRLPLENLVLPAIDLYLAGLFLWAYVSLPAAVNRQ